jgi:Flp pilus assembly protein TadG
VRRPRGETLIEFALTLAVFLMTILGMAEFGVLIFRYNMLSNLAQEGARRASVCGKNSSLSTSDCDINSFVQTRSLGINTTVSVTWSAGSASSSNPGDTVTVLVQHPFGVMTNIVPLAAGTMSSSAQMVVSR